MSNKNLTNCISCSKYNFGINFVCVHRCSNIKGYLESKMLLTDSSAVSLFINSHLKQL